MSKHVNVGKRSSKKYSLSYRKPDRPHAEPKVVKHLGSAKVTTKLPGGSEVSVCQVNNLVHIFTPSLQRVYDVRIKLPSEKSESQPAANAPNSSTTSTTSHTSDVQVPVKLPRKIDVSERDLQVNPPFNDAPSRQSTVSSRPDTPSSPTSPLTELSWSPGADTVQVKLPQSQEPQEPHMVLVKSTYAEKNSEPHTSSHYNDYYSQHHYPPQYGPYHSGGYSVDLSSVPMAYCPQFVPVIPVMYYPLEGPGSINGHGPLNPVSIGVPLHPMPLSPGPLSDPNVQNPAYYSYY